MNTSPNGRAFVAHEEGTVLHWYKDQADIETGGTGHVRRPGDPDTFTEAIADGWLVNDLRVAESCVNSIVMGHIGQNQFDACVSLAFNIGTGAFVLSSVVKFLNSGDYLAAADAFLLWNKITDPHTKELVVSPALAARRGRERELFLRDVATIPDPSAAA